jgi:glycine hydroxymethyltransferase
MCQQFVQVFNTTVNATATACILAPGGTDNHLLLWDARDTQLSGAKIEKMLEMVEISANKNAVIGDVSAISPGGVRLGTPAMTSRGMKEGDMERIAALIHRAVLLATDVQDKVCVYSCFSLVYYAKTHA